jgi:hypothetical protein
MENSFEGSQENSEKTERIEALANLFAEAEAVFEAYGRERAKPLLPKIYDALIAINKRDKKDYVTLWIWNPEGDLSEEEFNALNLRRKLLSNAIGIMTSSGEVRHDLNEI